MPSDFKLRAEHLALGHPMRKRVIGLIRLTLTTHKLDFKAAAAELGCSRALLYRLAGDVAELADLRRRKRGVK